MTYGTICLVFNTALQAQYTFQSYLVTAEKPKMALGVVIAAYGVVMYAAFIFLGVFNGYSQGSSPIVGYHYGAQNYKEVKNVLKRSLIILASAAIVLTAIAIGAAGVLSSVFVGYDAELLSMTTRAFQTPLYPMLDDRDTETSRDNHGRVWNTRKNHFAWYWYLRGVDREHCPVYAAPARLKDFHGLLPAYTFVGDGEPFYAETVRYIEALKACGIPADMDVYPTDTHAFDMMKPQESLSIKAAARFNEVFAYAKENYFASQAQN